MQFIITAHDGEGMLARRLEVRPQHLENMGKIKGNVLCAGGLLDEEGKMKGSVMVMDFPSKKLFDEYLESEPYVKAGVWQKITVERMNVVLLNGEKYIQ